MWLLLLSLVNIAMTTPLSNLLSVNINMWKCLRVLSIAQECVAENPCKGISRYANFGDFFCALLVLFKISTGDSWSGIMKDTMRPCRLQDHHCFDYFIWAAPLVFVTFVVLVQFTLFNLIVAAVMQALEESRNQDPDPLLEIGHLNQVGPEPPAAAPDQGDRLGPDPPEAAPDQGDRLARRRSTSSSARPTRQAWT
uniref:Ion transport domain-containing protein n=1 Tax=Knipowitschia caucasica TaxID=637954 RepID=A0AAV2JU76_KNICA